MVQIKAWGWGSTRVRLFGELEASGFVVRRTYEAEPMLLPTSYIQAYIKIIGMEEQN